MRIRESTTAKATPSASVASITFRLILPLLTSSTCSVRTMTAGSASTTERPNRKAFYKAMDGIGINEEDRKRRGITFHSWRHKFATDCVKANMHPLKITALTGHKSHDMLYRYTDLNAVNDLATEVNAIQKYRTAIICS